MTEGVMMDAGLLQNGTGAISGPEPVQEEEGPSLSITINNVVGSFGTKCHLNLKKIALEGTNVEYHRQHGMLNMRIRRPYTTASVWSSGKITCTGALSEEDSKIAARRFARKIQKMGYRVKFCNFRVVNVLGTCSLPFCLDIVKFSKKHKEASYEPELHPGVTYRIKSPKATLKIFSTGSITVTAPRVANIQSAIEYIYPLLVDFNAGPRSEKIETRVSEAHLMNKRKRLDNRVHKLETDVVSEPDSSDIDSEEFDSDDSQD